MERRLIRRLVTVPAIVLGAVVLLGTAPLWLLGAAVADVVRRRWSFPVVRLLGFALCWTWLEVAGVTASLALWLAGQSSNRRAHYALQRWWAARMIDALRFTCGVRLTVEGIEQLRDGPCVALCRHASLADALASAWVIGNVARCQPRYVLKKELTLDPCLDIVGNRLPNYFVDRAAVDTAVEVRGVARIAHDLGVNDVAIIFPEGTRSSPSKRERILARMGERDPERARRLQPLRHLLPPKVSGVRALLDAAPQARVVVMTHTGFEGFDTFGNIIRELTRGVRAHFVIEHVPRRVIPTDDSVVAWLDATWLQMDAYVERRTQLKGVAR